VRLKITSDQWQHVISKAERFVVLDGVNRDGIIDTTSSRSGVMACPDARIPMQGPNVVSCELFSGGFSGWSQSMRKLSELGYPFSHRLALDSEHVCALTFMRSHGFQHVVGPDDFTWGIDPLPESLFVEGDVTLHTWKHLFSDDAYDLLVMSPPCPPWSFAASQQGLGRADGRLTLHAWGVANILRPRIVLMEMVSGMKDHAHWKIILDFILWTGYSIRFARNLNLAEITPQHRDRLIIVATLDSADLFPHLPVTWPSTQRQTLETFMNILDIGEPWISQCRLNEDLLRIYLDPQLLPKSLDQRGRNMKRSRKDVEQYRVKHPHGVFGCIMSNYSFGHLLPDATLQHAGLFGTLLALPTGLRFMSVPEIIIAQSALMPCWFPDDHRASIRMLGNAIATPHALLALTNALAFLFELSGVEARDLMMQAMSQRMTARNIKWERKWGGFSFEFDEEVCQPTLAMHAEQCIKIRSPVDTVMFHAERNVNVLMAMKALVGRSLPNEINMLPGGDLDARVTLQAQMNVGDYDIQLFTGVPCALDIPLNAFSVIAAKALEIAVLTSDGPYVVRRDHGMTVQDVVTLIDHSFGIRCNHLTGLLGERHPMQMICPDAVFAMDIEGASDDLSILEFVDITIDDRGFCFRGQYPVLKEFFEFLHRTALVGVIKALGWILVADAQSVTDTCVNVWMLVRRPSALAIPQDELAYCLAIHLFLVKIRTWTTIGDEPAIRCRFKLWHAWVWDSLIDPTVTLDRFDDLWKRISKMFQIDKPWRYVVNGRCVSPDWRLSSYVQSDDDGNQELTVFLLLGLRGGGPLRLLSSDQAMHADNFQNFAHFESQDFEAALSVALKIMMPDATAIPRVDISDFLEIQSLDVDGMFTMKGNFQLLIKFLRMMKDTGMEEMLKKCGWFPACVFNSLQEPLCFDIIFVAMPQVPTVTQQFLKTLIKSALACLGMPKQVNASDAIMTKVKVWKVVAFHGFLPRMFPMQNFLDIWDQACTIVADHHEMNLVSHVGRVNPDMALKHFSRCGPGDVACANITFVGVLRGGGPNVMPQLDKMPAHAHELNIQQKNSLASFLLSQGAELKECVQFIESLIRGAGPNAIASVMGQKRVAKKWEGISQLSQALHIAMPPLGQKLQAANAKAKKKFQASARSLPVDLPVDALTIETGFLLNQDDTSCLQLQKIAPNVSGAVLMKYAEAKPWLEKRLVLSQDELVLIVVGVCDHQEPDKCLKIQLPVSLNSEPLIVQGCLHQLGARHVKVPDDVDNVIPQTDSQVVSFTAMKDEILPEIWDALIQSPVKNMLRLLGDDVTDVAFVSPPWGRSFQKQNKKVTPAQASTVQFHCRVQKSDLRGILRASGTGGIYTCPKTEDKQVSPDYMIVWTKSGTVDLAVSLSQCDNHFGLVRSFKGDTIAKGIRFTRHDFPAAFAKLRPNDDMPNIVSHNHFFRVEPTPVGTTMDQVQAWINTHGWRAKPVRSVNATTWLCVAEKVFDDVFPQWNNQPVLVKWIQQRRESKPVILAGNVQKVLQVTTKEPPSQSMTEAHFPVQDPWGAWIKNHGSSGLSQPNPGQNHVNVPAATVSQTRKIEAPIEDRFQSQDEQMQLIREVMEREIQSLKDNMQNLEKTVEDQKEIIDMNMEAAASEIRALKTDTSQQFLNMADVFKESLASAIHMHDAAMNAQFSEIKAMISSRSSVASPPQKKPRNTGVPDDGTGL